MATSRAAKAPFPRIPPREARKGPRSTRSAFAFVDYLGGAVAVAIGLGELIFFCAYIVAAPFMILLAIIKLPGWLRDEFRGEDEGTPRR